MKHLYTCAFILLLTVFGNTYSQPPAPCSTAVVVNMPDTVLPYYSRATDSMRWLTGGWYKLMIPAGKGIKGFLVYTPVSQFATCSTAGFQGAGGAIYKAVPGVSCDSMTQILAKSFHYCYQNGSGEWQRYFWELTIVNNVSDGDTFYLSMGIGSFGLKYLPYVIDSPFCANADTIAAFPFSGTNLCKAPLDAQITWSGYPEPLVHHVFFPTSDTVNLTIDVTSVYSSWGGYCKFSLFRDCAHVGDYSLDTSGHHKYFLDSAEVQLYYPFFIPSINLHTTRAVAGMPLTLVTYSNFGGFESAIGNTMLTYDIMGTGVALPVVLSAFHAYYHKLQNAVSLLWTTEAALKDVKFIIERSDNGGSFQAIGEVNGAGSNNYSYLDKNPLAGKMFYRLKLLKEDGKYSYSETEIVSIGGSSTISIYPNPAHGVVNVLFNLSGEHKADICISDVAGRVMLSQKQRLLNGSSIITMNIASFAKGIYFVKIRTGDGEEMVRKMIVK